MIFFVGESFFSTNIVLKPYEFHYFNTYFYKHSATPSTIPHILKISSPPISFHNIALRLTLFTHFISQIRKMQMPPSSATLLAARAIHRVNVTHQPKFGIASAQRLLRTSSRSTRHHSVGKDIWTRRFGEEKSFQ